MAPMNRIIIVAVLRVSDFFQDVLYFLQLPVPIPVAHWWLPLPAHSQGYSLFHLVVMPCRPPWPPFWVWALSQTFFCILVCIRVCAWILALPPVPFLNLILGRSRILSLWIVELPSFLVSLLIIALVFLLVWVWVLVFFVIAVATSRCSWVVELRGSAVVHKLIIGRLALFDGIWSAFANVTWYYNW